MYENWWAKRGALGAAIIAGSLLSGCQTGMVKSSAAWADSTPALKVEGRVGWRPGRTLRFGDFHTPDNVSNRIRSSSRSACSSTVPCVDVAIRGIDEGLAYRSSAQIEKMRQALNLVLVEGAGPRQVQVHAAGELDAESRSWALQVFKRAVSGGRQTVTRHQFIGSLLPMDGQGAQVGWRFALEYPEGAASPFLSEGWALRDGAAPETALAITPLRTVTSTDGRQTASLSPAMAPLGFEVRQGDRVLASIDLTNSGAVLLAPDLNAEERLVCGGLAAALLLRHDWVLGGR
ncbi:hypothetical protein [Inhella gelatinilytica]|uniref:Uncharacterized protein n=1 Tax=Inhella gelatinilytica TaxID=2795030 RepID=A0A931NBF2_9BURK|nr:hypothetical protein [Inhella gelatinilytica]MBH9553518.1 hypothetical protein [Inhella gelatinilytica]